MYEVVSIQIIDANQAGKCAITLYSCISVMDKVKINEQNKSNQ